MACWSNIQDAILRGSCGDSETSSQGNSTIKKNRHVSNPEYNDVYPCRMTSLFHHVSDISIPTEINIDSADRRLDVFEHHGNVVKYWGTRVDYSWTSGILCISLCLWSWHNLCHVYYTDEQLNLIFIFNNIIKNPYNVKCSLSYGYIYISIYIYIDTYQIFVA